MLDPRSLAQRTEASPRLPEGTPDAFSVTVVGGRAVSWDVTLAAPPTIRAMNPEQERLGDFRIPQRGLFVIGRALFEPLDPIRHRCETHAEDAVVRQEGS